MKPVLTLAGLGLLLSLATAGDRSGVRFRDVWEEKGVDSKHDRRGTDSKYLVETMGSGVALLDFNRDGHLDLYLVGGAPLDGAASSRGEGRLHQNRGDGTFRDVTEAAGASGSGYGMGVASGDYDNDGWVDLYLTQFGPNILYRNNGDGTFADVTDRAGVGDDRWGSSAAFFDFDNDGSLDLYVVNYLEYRLTDARLCGDEGRRGYCHPSLFPGARDVLYRNNGDGTFSDISHRSGVGSIPGRGLGIGLWDLDDDGFLDVYIANDTEMNFLLRNRGEGTFEDLSLVSGTALDQNGAPQSGMGVALGDTDGDGSPEIFVTNFESETNTLYRRESGLTFRDVTYEVGLGESSLPYVGFGTCFLDWDADGDLDLFVANGHILDNLDSFSDAVSYRQPNLLYENREGRFLEVSEPSRINRGGDYVSRGTALGDLDNDGDLDLVVSNSGGRPQILLNETPQGHRILLELVGSRSNRSAIGARLDWRREGKVHSAFVDPSGSYLSARDPRLFVGLGESKLLSGGKIRWPSGMVQELSSLESGYRYRLVEGEQVEKIGVLTRKD